MKKSVYGTIAVSLAGLLIVAMTSTRSVGDGDASPKACVDCHKGETKLSTKLAAWTVKVDGPIAAHVAASMPKGVKAKGKHPKLPFGKAIPKSCLGCHGKTSKMAPPFSQLMHLIHETGANKIDCASCHKLDAATGVMSVPSGDEQ